MLGILNQKKIPILIFLLLSACSAQSKLATISGKIMISSSLASKIGPSDVIFVMAYPEEAESQPETQKSGVKAVGSPPPPLAVEKIMPPVFPAHYQLSKEDVIFPERRFEGALQIRARLDKDGNAKTVQTGDLEGVYKKNPVSVGSKNVDIVIDQEKQF